MKKDKLLRAEEVALMIGKSSKTINTWYSFKKQFPDNKYAKMLPEYEQATSRSIRLWHSTDIHKLKEFANIIKTGRNGFLGPVTHKKEKINEDNKEVC